jgi:subtilisin family serine protease
MFSTSHWLPTLTAGLLGAALLSPQTAAQHANGQAEPGLPAGSAAPHELDGRLVQVEGRWHLAEFGRHYPVLMNEVSARPMPGIGVDRLLAALAAAGIEASVTRISRLEAVDFELRGAEPAFMALAALRNSGLVRWAELSALGAYTLQGPPSNDALYGEQWYLENTGQSGGLIDADMDAQEAWALEVGDPSVIVSVIDSGTSIFHQDLAANIFVNAGEIEGNGLDDDNNGRIDDVRGWDFANNDNDPTSTFFHGTAVASCVAAVRNNGVQLAGLAGGDGPGTGVRVLACGIGAFFPIASVIDDAVIYSADMGARVITLSFGVPSSQAIIDALRYAHDQKGVFIDCAAGNNGGTIGFPANQPEVMAVGSTNRFDQRSNFSSFGPSLEVMAPGESVLMLSLNNGTTTSDGTSFSAPLTAAAAALVFSANPGLTNTDVRQLLKDTADDLGAPGFDTLTGFGRINAGRAVSSALGLTPGKFIAYGSGLAGTNGLKPVINYTGGLPKVGNGAFALTINRAGPNLAATLGVSAGTAQAPFFGGTLYLDLSQVVFTATAVTSPLGVGSLGVPIPNLPALVGLPFEAQWAVLDPQGPQGLALSNAATLQIGS